MHSLNKYIQIYMCKKGKKNKHITMLRLKQYVLVYNHAEVETPSFWKPLKKKKQTNKQTNKQKQKQKTKKNKQKQIHNYDKSIPL